MKIDDHAEYEEQNKISDYLPEHYPENQTCERVQGYFISPKLRDDFDSTPNEKRHSLELEHWFGRPYIDIEEFAFETYQDHVTRMGRFGIELDIESETEFYESQQQSKESWFKAWPTGKRFESRCLTGGAWDRASTLGMFATLDEAIARCKQDIILFG